MVSVMLAAANQFCLGQRNAERAAIAARFSVKEVDPVQLRSACTRALVALAATLALSSGAAAQTAGTGTLTGHLVLCRTAPRPVAGASAGLDMADVTPGFNRHMAPPIHIPADGVQLSIQGTSLSTTTDAVGAFTFAGVPAAQPLTLLAQPDPGPTLVLSSPSLVVTTGQTLDLGTVGLSACGDTTIAFTPSPSTATNPQSPDAQPTDTQPAEDTPPADGATSSG